MKNIHLIPTDKPTGIFKSKNGLHFSIIEKIRYGELKEFHIYITNDEKTKPGDWVLFMFDEVTEIVKVTTIINNSFDSKKGFGYGLEYCKKIILTTDEELVKDGIQAIDDEFLEWFVKNPSCEEIEVNDWLDTNGNIAFGGDKRYQICNHLYDKIIISKEEPKQETIEAAKLYRKASSSLMFGVENGFIAGAKWQSERMFSEDDVIKIVEKSRITGLTAEYLIEQFKNK